MPVRPARILVALALLAAAPLPATADPDPAAGLATSLADAERAFAASVAARDRDRFASFIADEAIFAGAAVSRGKAAILAAWEGFFRPDGPTLAWEPTTAEVQAGGPGGAVLGLTRGPYTLTAKRPDGTEAVGRGTFNSVWRREPDGSWKVLFDAGCPPCPACG